MPNGNPTVVDLLEDLRRVHTANPSGETTRNYYREHGTFSESAWSRHYPRFSDYLAAAGVQAAAPKEVESVEYTDNGMSIELDHQTDVRTLEQLIKSRKIDMGVWHCKRFIANEWDFAGVRQYQVKAEFVPRKELIAAREEIESLKDEVKRVVRIPKSVIRELPSSGNMLEILIPDLHAGKLCWSKETGYQDYDTSIAIETYRRALDSLLIKCQGYKFDRIVLGVGQDLLQSDNIQGTTYSGTKVDTDTRFHKTYKVVREMLSETIEKLRLIAPVEVKLVPGNHDTLSVFTLGDSLECRFHGYTDVVVDNSPILHKTVEWGKVFLLLTHGHQGKHADYGIWMASQYPKEFGRTSYREIHVGHRHKTALDEKFGIRIRTFSSLTPADAWHANNNFVNNLRVAEALVWNKDKGLVAQFYHTED